MCNIDLEIGSVFCLGQFYVLRKNDFTLGNKLLNQIRTRNLANSFRNELAIYTHSYECTYINH